MKDIKPQVTGVFGLFDFKYLGGAVKQMLTCISS